MRISWYTERVMALTPPTVGRVQAHGNGVTKHALDSALIT